MSSLCYDRVIETSVTVLTQDMPIYQARSHRVQRSEVRAERLVFLAKDNRHNLLRTCVTRVT